MKKIFDAVKEVRDIRDKLYKKTKNMTRAEKIVFYRNQAQELYTQLRIEKTTGQRL